MNHHTLSRVMIGNSGTTYNPRSDGVWASVENEWRNRLLNIFLIVGQSSVGLNFGFIRVERSLDEICRCHYYPGEELKVNMKV